MTKNRMCVDCGIRWINRDNTADNELCGPCNEYAEWENTHNDNSHDQIAADNIEGVALLDAFVDALEIMPNCPVCHPELDPRTAPVRTSHTNTVAKTYRSHAGCKHARTARDRAACRKAGGPKA